MKAELAQIAQAYEAASRYPSFSQPVFSKEALEQFMPETPSAVSLPFPREDGRPGVRISLSLDRYQYFPADTLLWKLDLQDPEGRKSWQARLSVRALSGAVLIPEQAVADVVQGVLSLPEPQPGVTEYQLQVRIESEGERYFISAPFRLNPAVARINGLSWAHQDGPWLNMALSTDVFLPGYYFLSANLYNAMNGEPVVHLEAEQRLAAGSTTMTLKAHGSALRARGDAGPYVLKDIRLIRGAEEGEPEDLAGQPPGAPVPVPGFALDTWDDTPWEDPEAAERTEFLKKLAGFSQEP
ncbi:MAG: hypothetical protein D6758_11495 [Gammaproteobacteria bacterium]|nr:MAG: hypothetical protein D6758_11495 [Gammaproteobacteria bacterium]